jgi:hypothetical protein
LEMSTGWDRFAKVVTFVVPTLSLIVNVIVNGTKLWEALSALPTLVWGVVHGCLNIIALVVLAEVILDWAIGAKPDQTPVSNAMKVGAVLLPLPIMFVISDVCPRLGFAILKALRCA